MDFVANYSFLGVVYLMEARYDDKIIQTESDSVSFKLENYEGPLDLLLTLIKQSKMEIQDVKLSEITEQYLNIIGNLKEVDMEGASEFIEVAATLIEIKSKSLLPKLEETNPEDDPEYLLKQRLIQHQEYLLIKEQIENLKPLENTNRFYKNPEPDASKFRVVIKDMQLDMLLDAFANIMVRVHKEKKEEDVKEVVKEKFTVVQKIATIKDSLLIRKKVFFSELFSQSISREEVITTFMALLELLKLQEIHVSQNHNFADIEIRKNDEDTQTGVIE